MASVSCTNYQDIFAAHLYVSLKARFVEEDEKCNIEIPREGLIYCSGKAESQI